MFLKLIPAEEREGKKCRLCNTTLEVKFQLTTLDGNWCTKCTKYIIQTHLKEGDKTLSMDDEVWEAATEKDITE